MMKAIEKMDKAQTLKAERVFVLEGEGVEGRRG